MHGKLGTLKCKLLKIWKRFDLSGMLPWERARPGQILSRQKSPGNGHSSLCDAFSSISSQAADTLELTF